VSRLQQRAKIALAHNCVPGIAIISAMMIPPQVVIDVAQGVRACGSFIFVGAVNSLAWPSLKHPRCYHARTRVAVRGIGKAVDYSDGKKLDEGDAALAPANCIGRLRLAEEAQQLSDRMCAAKADGALRLVGHGD
jgi:hypothetical protein